MAHGLKVDLHSHTTCSDGRASPAELVRQARAAGVDLLAVTDHDTTDALDEAEAEGRKAGVRVVAGIEMSCQASGQDVHLLGLGVDRAHPEFREALKRLQESRRARVDRICDALRSQGLALSAADVLAEAGGKSVGRKHVAQAMVRKGLVRAVEEAFEKHLRPGRPAHVPANELAPAEAARIIRRAGGVPVLAHPAFYGDDRLVEGILDAASLRAIEVYHRYGGERTHLRYLEMARRRDLVATGGSDFHGDEHRNNARLGEFTTPPAEWRRLERMLRG